MPYILAIISVGWVGVVFTYLNMNVGFDNFFAQLPWEVLVSMIALLTPVVLCVIMSIRTKESDEKIIADAIDWEPALQGDVEGRVLPRVKTVIPMPKCKPPRQEIPVEELIPGIKRVLKEALNEVPLR